MSLRASEQLQQVTDQVLSFFKRIGATMSTWFGNGQLDNEALVFIKPHAANDDVKELVEAFFKDRGIEITDEGVLTGKEINDRGIVDAHYAHIATIAMKKDPADLHVSEESQAAFKETFGESWAKAVAAERVMNLQQFEAAFEALSVSSINDAWMHNVERVKLAPGTYVGYFPEQKRYVLNAFYGAMREVYTAKSARIIYFTVRFNEDALSWKDFRSVVIGATNPVEAASGSLRNKILVNWKELGLEREPDVGENGVHASAGPIEGLRERIVWLGTRIEDDLFGRELLEAGVDRKLLEKWLENQVVTIDGVCKHAFDLLEDLDSSVVVERALSSVHG